MSVGSTALPTPTPVPIATPSPSPAPSPSPTTLFSDDFSHGFPGTNWIVSRSSPMIDPSVGNPAPSLKFLATGSDSIGGIIQSAVNPFSTSGGISISAGIGFPTGTPTFSTFTIQDENHGDSAQLTIEENGPGTAEYSIFSAGHLLQVIQPFNVDNKFHTYTLQVDGFGNVAWLRDGVRQASAGSFSSNNLILLFQGGNPSVPTYIDNVVVRGP